MEATVNFEGSTSESFGVRCGVKQGCVLAPTLFGIFFSALLHHAFGDDLDEDSVYLYTRADGQLFSLARLRAKTKRQRVLVRELLFADDAAFVSHGTAGLQRLMDKFSSACDQFSLVISVKKTVVLHQQGSLANPITVKDETLAAVEKFTYLGSTTRNDLSMSPDVQTRIGKASTTFSRLRSRVWKNKYLTIRTKTRIYTACVLSVLLYGSEAWTTYRWQERKLNAVHFRCLRNTLGITWKDKITNAEVLHRTGSNTLFYILTQRRLRWLGHVRRMPCGHLPKDILYGELATGRRDLGRPKLRFKDVVKRDLRTARLDEEWESMALQRPQWRKAVTHASAQCKTQYIERLALHN